jgi:hypothetical protein
MSWNKVAEFGKLNGDAIGRGFIRRRGSRKSTRGRGAAEI